MARERRFRSGARGRDLGATLAVEMEAQRAAFVEKFGREPGPGDPVFFDPDAAEPTRYSAERLTAEMVISMIRAEVPEPLIYSYLRTGGLLVTEENFERLPEEDKAALEQAVEEYERTFGAAPPAAGRRRRRG